MKLIQDNPYRIAGILSSASERELDRQKAKISKFATIGRQVDSEIDFQFMPAVDRTDVNTVSQAFSAIEQSEGKVSHSLFWFLKSNTFDETAINYLINGDIEKATEIWRKVTDAKETNSKNYSCFNNLGTLKLLGQSKQEIKEGIEAKIKLIESPSFEDFVQAVADQTYTLDNQKQAEKFVDDILKELKRRFSNAEMLQLFSNCNGASQKYLSQRFTEEPLYKMESLIESTKNKRKINKSRAYQLGIKLFKECKEDLSTLKSLLGTSDLKYKMIADSLAKEVMQCGIDYFNKCEENYSNQDYIKQAQELNKLALTIAVGKLVRERAQDHISTLEEMKDREVAQVVALLNTVKNAYDTNEQTIRQQVEELKKSDREIRLGYRTINEEAVEQNIKTSIDWVKVNDLLKDILTDANLEKIKYSFNDKLKSEFLELAFWLQENSQSNKFISRIISIYKKIPPKLPFKVLSSEITNTNNQPLYTKFIRYIGLKINVDVESERTITFDLKYINPNGSLNRNSDISPKGYSQSVVKAINKNDTSIEFPGWGNGGECIYSVGEHRIEVYIDEYLIHTKKYMIETAPSEILGKEIARAEKKLNQIYQTDYFESEIRSAENELKEIQKFKWLRESSEKHRQVQAQQRKIDDLIEKAKNEKIKQINTQEKKIIKLKRELLEARY